MRGEAARVEKLTSPSVASRIILRSVYFELPANRSGHGIRHGDLAEAEPGEHPAHEAIPFRHRAKRLDDAAVGEAEVAGGGGDLDARELAQHPVVRCARSCRLSQPSGRSVMTP